MSANADLVARFCAAWSNLNADELLDYFSDDAVYHNMPMAPLQGKPAIKAILDQIVSPCTAIKWEMLRMSENGDVVFTERRPLRDGQSQDRAAGRRRIRDRRRQDQGLA